MHHASDQISGFFGGLTAIASAAMMSDGRRETWWPDAARFDQES
jgi:hypothetical protein